jgi:hypothetical protein
MRHNCSACGRRTAAAADLTPAAGWQLRGRTLRPAPAPGWLCPACASARPKELARDLRQLAAHLVSLAALVESGLQ